MALIYEDTNFDRYKFSFRIRAFMLFIYFCLFLLFCNLLFLNFESFELSFDHPGRLNDLFYYSFLNNFESGSVINLIIAEFATYGYLLFPGTACFLFSRVGSTFLDPITPEYWKRWYSQLFVVDHNELSGNVSPRQPDPRKRGFDILKSYSFDIYGIFCMLWSQTIISIPFNIICAIFNLPAIFPAIINIGFLSPLFEESYKTTHRRTVMLATTEFFAYVMSGANPLNRLPALFMHLVLGTGSPRSFMYHSFWNITTLLLSFYGFSITHVITISTILSSGFSFADSWKNSDAEKLHEIIVTHGLDFSIFISADNRTRLIIIFQRVLKKMSPAMCKVYLKYLVESIRHYYAQEANVSPSSVDAIPQVGFEDFHKLLDRIQEADLSGGLDGLGDILDNFILLNLDSQMFHVKRVLTAFLVHSTLGDNYMPNIKWLGIIDESYIKRSSKNSLHIFDYATVLRSALYVIQDLLRKDSSIQSVKTSADFTRAVTWLMRNKFTRSLQGAMPEPGQVSFEEYRNVVSLCDKFVPKYAQKFEDKQASDHFLYYQNKFNVIREEFITEIAQKRRPYIVIGLYGGVHVGKSSFLAQTLAEAALDTYGFQYNKKEAHTWMIRHMAGEKFFSNYRPLSTLCYLFDEMGALNKDCIKQTAEWIQNICVYLDGSSNRVPRAEIGAKGNEQYDCPVTFLISNYSDFGFSSVFRDTEPALRRINICFRVEGKEEYKNSKGELDISKIPIDEWDTVKLVPQYRVPSKGQDKSYFKDLFEQGLDVKAAAQLVKAQAELSMHSDSRLAKSLDAVRSAKTNLQELSDSFVTFWRLRWKNDPSTMVEELFEVEIPHGLCKILEAFILTMRRDGVSRTNTYGTTLSLGFLTFFNIYLTMEDKKIPDDQILAILRALHLDTSFSELVSENLQDTFARYERTECEEQAQAHSKEVKNEEDVISSPNKTIYTCFDECPVCSNLNCSGHGYWDSFLHYTGVRRTVPDYPDPLFYFLANGFECGFNAIKSSVINAVGSRIFKNKIPASGFLFSQAQSRAYRIQAGIWFGMFKDQLYERKIRPRKEELIEFKEKVRDRAEKATRLEIAQFIGGLLFAAGATYGVAKLARSYMNKDKEEEKTNYLPTGDMSNLHPFLRGEKLPEVNGTSNLYDCKHKVIANCLRFQVEHDAFLCNLEDNLIRIRVKHLSRNEEGKLMENSLTVHGIMSGGYLITVWHALRLLSFEGASISVIRHAYKPSYIKNDVEIEEEFATVEKEYTNLQNYIYRIGKSDCGVVKLPGVIPCKKIDKSWSPHVNPGGTSSKGRCFLLSFDGPKTYNYRVIDTTFTVGEVSYHTTRNPYCNESVTIPNAFKLKLKEGESYDGLCGSILAYYDSNSISIVGIYSAVSSIDGKGVVQPVSWQSVENVISIIESKTRITPCASYETHDNIIASISAFDNCDYAKFKPSPDKRCTAHYLKASEVLGSNYLARCDELRRFTPTSKIKETPIKKFVDNTVLASGKELPTFKRSEIDGRLMDNRMQNAIARNRTGGNVNICHLELVIDHLVERWKIDDLKHIRFMDVSTALSGHSKNCYATPAPRATSDGQLPITKPKFTHFVDDVDETRPDGVTLNAESYRRLERDWLRAQQGKPVGMVGIACDKDEPVSEKKNRENRQRVFNAVDIFTYVRHKQFFGMFLAIFSANYTLFETMCGINPYSEDWDVVARKMFKYKNAILIDYKNYDVTLQSVFINAALTIVKRLMEHSFVLRGVKPPDCWENICKSIVRDFLTPIIVDGKDIWMLDGNVFSGMLLTLLINNICNSIIIRMAFLYTLDPAYVVNDHKIVKGTLEYLEDNISISCQGDDNMMTLSDDLVKIFTYQEIKNYTKSIGMTVTMADKNADDSTYAYEPSENIEICKRKFRWDVERQRYAAPLDLSSMGKCLSFYKNGALSMDEQIIENIRTTIYELAQHGRAVFDEQVKVFSEMPEYGKYFLENTYDEVITKIEGVDFFPWTGDVSENLGEAIAANLAGPLRSRIGTIKHGTSSIAKRVADGEKDYLVCMIKDARRRTEMSQKVQGLPCGDAETKSFRVNLKRLATLDNITEDSHALTAEQHVTGVNSLEEKSQNTHSNENVEFQEGGPTVLADVKTARDQTFSGTLSDPSSLAKFLSRDTFIFPGASITGGGIWTNTGIGFQLSNLTSGERLLDPWTIWQSDQRIRDKLRNFTYLAGDLVLSIRINGSPFQMGRLFFAYIPYQLASDAADWASEDNRNQVASLANLLINSGSSAGGKELLAIRHFSTYPHGFLDPSVSSTLELRCPMVWHNNAFNITSQVKETPGMLLAYPICPLTVANDNAPVEAKVNIYARMDNVKVAIPTEFEPSAGDEYSQEENTRKSTNSIADSISSIPIIGKMAKASQIGLEAAGDIGKLFGFNKPTAVDNTEPVNLKLTSNFANTSGNDQSESLALDPKQEVTIGGDAVGLDPVDEMAFEHIVTQEQLLSVARWEGTSGNLGQANSKLIFMALVSPDCSETTDGVITFGGNSWQPSVDSPMGHVANMFKFWKGSIIYRFEVVCTGHHSGRLLIQFDPFASGTASLGDLTVNDINARYSMILDLKESKTCEFTVNYVNDRPWLNTGDSSEHDANFWPGRDSDDNTNLITAFARFDRTKHLGIVTCSILNEAVGPIDVTNANPLRVMVFARAGNDMCFACPNQGDVDAGWTKFLYMPRAASEQQEYLPQADCEQSVPALVPKDEALFMGEAVRSWRTYAKRYVNNAAFNSQGAVAGDAATWIRNVPMHPPCASRNLDRFNTVEAYMAACYICKRGSMRFRFIATQYKANSGANFNNANVEIITTANRFNVDSTTTPGTWVMNPATVNTTDAATLSATIGQFYDGGTLRHQSYNRMVDVALPWYSNQRFELACNPFNVQEASTQTIIMSKVMDTTPLLQVTWTGMNALIASSGDDMIALQYSAIGDDYSASFFVGVPIRWNHVPE